MAEQDLDVVVFGATGVTGRRVAAYLAERAKETGAHWAAAARDAAKLERVLDEAGVSAPETVVADLDDPESLAAMASRARVVLNLVGPYTLYGRPVIEACVAGGAHYADLTGEIPFVRQMIDAFADRAAQAGVKLVQVCGFESLPPDLAVLLAAETARERWGEDLAEADLEASIRRRRACPVPPTWSPAGRCRASPPRRGRGRVGRRRPRGADHRPGRRRGGPPAQPDLSRAPASGAAVIAPMAPAAFINPAVIQRTAALLAAERGARPSRSATARASRPGRAASLPLRYAMAGATRRHPGRPGDAQPAPGRP